MAGLREHLLDQLFDGRCRAPRRRLSSCRLQRRREGEQQARAHLTRHFVDGELRFGRGLADVDRVTRAVRCRDGQVLVVQQDQLLADLGVLQADAAEGKPGVSSAVTRIAPWRASSSADIENNGENWLSGSPVI